MVLVVPTTNRRENCFVRTKSARSPNSRGRFAPLNWPMCRDRHPSIFQGPLYMGVLWHPHISLEFLCIDYIRPRRVASEHSLPNHAPRQMVAIRRPSANRCASQPAKDSQGSPLGPGTIGPGQPRPIGPVWTQGRYGPEPICTGSYFLKMPKKTHLFPSPEGPFFWMLFFLRVALETEGPGPHGGPGPRPGPRPMNP